MMIDVQQIVYALQRQATALDAQAERMGMDYNAEFPAEDAERMREAISILGDHTTPELLAAFAEKCGGEAGRHEGVVAWVKLHGPAVAAFAAALVAPEQKPIDMVLYCPECGRQHIDAPEWAPGLGSRIAPTELTWANPPHRSHLCSGCGHIWRPADVATNGVRAIQTKGTNDSPLVTPVCRWHEPVATLLEAYDYGQFADDMLDHPSPSCRSPCKPVREALRRLLDRLGGRRGTD